MSGIGLGSVVSYCMVGISSKAEISSGSFLWLFIKVMSGWQHCVEVKHGACESEMGIL